MYLLSYFVAYSVWDRSMCRLYAEKILQCLAGVTGCEKPLTPKHRNEPEFVQMSFETVFVCMFLFVISTAVILAIIKIAITPT